MQLLRIPYMVYFLIIQITESNQSICDHLKMPQSIFYGFLFFWWALWNVIAFRFWLIIAIPLNDAMLGFHLGNVQIRNLQPRMLQHIGFDFLIGRLGFRLRNIQLCHIQINVDM